MSYRIPIPSATCSHEYKLGNNKSEISFYRTIYEACLPDEKGKCSHAMIIYLINPGSERTAFSLEPESETLEKKYKYISKEAFDDIFTVSNKMGEYGIGPKTNQSWSCKDDNGITYGIILTDRIDGNIYDIFKNLCGISMDEFNRVFDIVFQKLYKKVENLVGLGLFHEGLTEFSVVLKDNEPYIVDFDKLRPLSSNEDERKKEVKLMLDTTYDIGHRLFDFCTLYGFPY